MDVVAVITTTLDMWRKPVDRLQEAGYTDLQEFYQMHGYEPHPWPETSEPRDQQIATQSSACRQGTADFLITMACNPSWPVRDTERVVCRTVTC